MSHEPGIVLVKPWGEDQGAYVRINEADFDPAVHVMVHEGGHARVFDPLDHDHNGVRGGSPRPEPSADLTALRAEYHAKLGKKAFGGWDAETIRAKIEAAAAQ